jgi:hypothetical protein
MPVLLRHSRHITGRSRSEAKQLQGRGTRGSRRRLQGPLRPGLPRRGRRRLRTGRRRRRHEGPRLSGLRPPNSNPDISVRVGFWKTVQSFKKRPVPISRNSCHLESNVIGRSQMKTFIKLSVHVCGKTQNLSHECHKKNTERYQF